MAGKHTATLWTGLKPQCDICITQGKSSPAKYDAMLPNYGGSWGNVCESHFRSSGARLGLGLGQKIMSAEEYLDYAWKKNP